MCSKFIFENPYTFIALLFYRRFWIHCKQSESKTQLSCGHNSADVQVSVATPWTKLCNSNIKIHFREAIVHANVAAALYTGSSMLRNPHHRTSIYNKSFTVTACQVGTAYSIKFNVQYLLNCSFNSMFTVLTNEEHHILVKYGKVSYVID